MNTKPVPTYGVRLTHVLIQAHALNLEDLLLLDEWLHERIRDMQQQGEQTPAPPRGKSAARKKRGR